MRSVFRGNAHKIAASPVVPANTVASVGKIVVTTTSVATSGVQMPPNGVSAVSASMLRPVALTASVPIHSSAYKGIAKLHLAICCARAKRVISVEMVAVLPMLATSTVVMPHRFVAQVFVKKAVPAFIANLKSGVELGFVWPIPVPP